MRRCELVDLLFSQYVSVESNKLGGTQLKYDYFGGSLRPENVENHWAIGLLNVNFYTHDSLTGQHNGYTKIIRQLVE